MHRDKILHSLWPPYLHQQQQRQQTNVTTLFLTSLFYSVRQTGEETDATLLRFLMTMLLLSKLDKNLQVLNILSQTYQVFCCFVVIHIRGLLRESEYSPKWLQLKCNGASHCICDIWKNKINTRNDTLIWTQCAKRRYGQTLIPTLSNLSRIYLGIGNIFSFWGDLAGNEVSQVDGSDFYAYLIFE